MINQANIIYAVNTPPCVTTKNPAYINSVSKYVVLNLNLMNLLAGLQVKITFQLCKSICPLFYNS